MSGWFLSLVGPLGILYVLITSFNAFIQARRGNPFEEVRDAYLLFLPLTEEGEITQYFLAALVVFTALFVVGAFLLRAARNVTLELRATEAEVNRRMRVEERLREQRGSHA